MSALLAVLFAAAVPGPTPAPLAVVEPLVPAEPALRAEPMHVPAATDPDEPEPDAEVVAPLAPALSVEALGDQPAARPRHYLFAMLETGLLFGGGTWWYWSGKATSSKWDLRFDWDSWERKVDLSGVRFDADRFNTNASSHPRAGMGYYQTARGNGLSFAQSYLWVFLTSLMWEYVVEFNEYPSINDIILTPTAGVVMGESLYRLSRFFDASSPSLVNRAGAFLFSPFAEINDLISGRKHTSQGPTDELGLTRIIHHRFKLAMDQLACSFDGRRSDQQAVGLDTALVSHSAYRRPGHGWAAVKPGQWSDIGARLFFLRGKGVQGIDIHSNTVLAGRYFRRYAEPPAGETWRRYKPHGWGAMLGLGSSFDYLTRQLDPGEDRVASAGLLGPMAEITSDRGPLGIRFALSSYYSFAMVESLAYQNDANPAESTEISTTLRNQGYYYGHGMTSAGLLAVRLGDLELKLGASFAAYWSLNGRDRFQEHLQGDLAVSDTRSRGVASADVRPFGGPVLVTGSLEQLERSGQLAGHTSSSQETRAGLGAGLVF